MTPPKVSILVLAYNHGPYLRQALDGILQQEVNFDYVVHVAEDCSTDDTREIVLDYQKRFPDRIQAHLNPKNLGGKQNLIQNYRRLDGDYVAELDGDDYWTSPLKLKTQVEFLETHPEFVAAAHNTLVIREGAEPKPIVGSLNKDVLTIEDLIETCYVHTSSFLSRNIFRGQLPSTQEHALAGDWFLSLLYAQHGKVKYFDEIMSVYRMHREGEWSQMTPLQQKMRNIDAMVCYDRFLGYRYSKAFRRIRRECDELLNQATALNLATRLKYRFLRKSFSLDEVGSQNRIARFGLQSMYRLMNQWV
jgi:glycosyltransferase involved in cell wall biosynthesis